MLTCGLKITHDASVAVFSDDRLLFSVEIEKIGNNARYSGMPSFETVDSILRDFGLAVGDIDQFVIDGWVGATAGYVPLAVEGRIEKLRVAGYYEPDLETDLLSAVEGTFDYRGGAVAYRSYPHAAGHVAAAYGSSPFAPGPAGTLVLVWDGGMAGRLYLVDEEGALRNGGRVFSLVGHAYAAAADVFGPFRSKATEAQPLDLTVAGKLMAYIALGTFRQEIFEVFAKVFATAPMARDLIDDGSNEVTRDVPQPLHWRPVLAGFYEDVRRDVLPLGYSDEDVLATMHEFLGHVLLTSLRAHVTSWLGDGSWPLVFTGGCALNIKWNSTLRADPMFTSVWVPPFPNDSGAGIGAAAADRWKHGGDGRFEWNVRSGPEIGPVLPTDDETWGHRPADVRELARVLHERGEPVVVLDGRAELGPRALGARSIIAPASDPGMKEVLNEVKGRESYRPVAPICLEERASHYFDPGTPDPYMLFEHRVRDERRADIPAVIHLDGTARLQTVGPNDTGILRDLLVEYERLSGSAVLCNTSANLNGSGFFPDVASVIAWGRVDLIWCDGVIYEKIRDLVD